MKLQFLVAPEDGQVTTIGDKFKLEIWQMGDITIKEQKTILKLVSSLDTNKITKLVTKIMIEEELPFEDVQKALSSDLNDDDRLMPVRLKYLSDYQECLFSSEETMLDLIVAKAYAIKNRLAIPIEKYLEDNPGLTKQVVKTKQEYINYIRNLPLDKVEDFFPYQVLKELAAFYDKEQGATDADSEEKEGSDKNQPDVEEVVGKSTIIDVNSSNGTNGSGELETTGPQTKGLPPATTSTAPED